MFKQSFFSSLAAFLMLIAVSVCQAQNDRDPEEGIQIPIFRVAGVNESKYLVCNRKRFIMGSDNKVYELIQDYNEESRKFRHDDPWREIGRGVSDIGCSGTTFTCIHNGNTHRYLGDLQWNPALPATAAVTSPAVATVSNPLPEITCGALKYRKTAANDVEEFKNGAWRTVGRGVSEISCTGQGELKVMYNGSPLYFQGEPDKWATVAFTQTNVSKRLVCAGKFFIMGANSNVYEFHAGAWREIGRDVSDIGCDGTTFTCVPKGRMLRYQGSPNNWQ